MDFIIDKFPLLIILAVSVIGWIKKRADQKREEEEARTAREEMIRSLEELENLPKPAVPQHRPATPPVLQRSAPQPVTPPPLVWNAKPQVAPPPLVEQPGTAASAQRNTPPRQSTPTPSFDYQTKLMEARQASEASKLAADQAVAKRITASTQAAHPQPAPEAPRNLRHSLRRKGSLRQAVVLREILGPPVAMR
jgi:type IV secretory pathway VirB10-like protein